MKPEVSVIIPAYNAEAYLAETIESARAQTFRSFEILVIDDGSSDNSADVAERFTPQVRVLRKKNGGPASARNLGIRESSGKYIAFLDSDDLWMPDKLARQVAYFESHPAVGLLYGEALMFRIVDGEKRLEGKIGYTGEASLRLLLYGDFIPNSTVMIRRECIDRVGLLNESRDLIAVEDYEYWMRIAKEFPIAGMPEPLAWYRLRDGNLMGDGKDIDKGLRLSMAALREFERQHPEIWREQAVDREQLFARMHVRAGFAWRKRGNWRACARKYADAIRESAHPRVFRWIAAATVLDRWS